MISRFFTWLIVTPIDFWDDYIDKNDPEWDRDKS